MACPIRPRTPDERCAQFVRQWNLAVSLRRRRRTLAALAAELGCATRTVRRDLEVLQAAGLPVTCVHVTSDERKFTVWTMGECDAWPRDARMPVEPLSPEGAPGAAVDQSRIQELRDDAAPI